MGRREQQLPAGVVTFFLTDIEGSSPLLRRLGEDAYIPVIERHHASIRQALDEHGGVEFNTAGDAFLVAFEDASAAVAAALRAQQLLAGADGVQHTVRVRMALHTGPARVVAGDYVSLALNRAARVLSAAHGGQVLLTEETVTAAARLPPAVSVRGLGTYRLRDFDGPVDLFELAHASLPRVEAELRARRAPSHNLPTFAAPLVGRTQELATITELLLENRLVTLTGPGGVGKTRAAVAVATEICAITTDGVTMVPLAGVTDAAAVASAFADNLGIRHVDGRSALDAVCETLEDRDVTIVVDNCEHVRDAAADVVGQVLLRCADARLLATSRTPLGIPGEQLYRMPPMPLPASVEDPADVLASEAVQLFAERARRADHRFELAAHGPTVARICERLDGLPLALELAAARLRSLPVAQLELQLEDALGVLESDDRSRPSRQASLERLLDWSRTLLSVEEETWLRRLSVFRGGWELAAAEAVCGTDEGPARAFAVVTALVDHSLVHTGGGGRFHMLQLVADYASRCLDEAGERRRAEARHLTWCVGEVADRDRADVLEACRREGDNQRAALSREDPALARDQLELATAVSLSWARLGWGDAAVRSLERGLQSVDDRDLRVRAGLALAFLEAERGRLDAAESAVGAARSDAAPLDGHAYAGELSYNAGRILLRRRRLREARRALEEAIEADVAEGGDGLRAVNELGVLELMGDDPGAGVAWFARAVDIATARGDAWVISQTTANLAEALTRLGRYDEAWRTERRALRERRRLGDRVGIAHSLFGLGNIEAARGHHERAVGLIAAGDALCRELEHELRADDAAVVESSLVAARQALGAERFGALWVTAGDRPLDELVDGPA